MPEYLHYDVNDRVAVLTIDNPPVNVLSAPVWDALAEGIARAGADALVDAVVLTGAGSTFVAGADINVFSTLKTRELTLARSAAMHALLRTIEDSAKPVVVAIRGFALGGGLELAMSCHFRVATSDASVGQPEVLLGLIPGAGGTQRLPRLCGAQMALTMCIDGRPVPAKQAAAGGIIDELIDGDLVTGAIRFAKTKAGSAVRRTREIVFTAEDVRQGLEACAKARAMLNKEPTAPFAVTRAIEAALTLDFDAGSECEREIFADCLLSTESKALRHLFFAEREAAKVPDLPKNTPAAEVNRAAVVGAGTMGCGIAMTFANAGIPVLLKDVDADTAQRGLAMIRKNYEASMAKGKITAEKLERTMALITPTATLDGFDATDIIVEAVFEDMALKKATFAELGRAANAGCILASNTSTLDIDALAESSGRPAQVLGLHFFSPANVMKLLEVVRGRDTAGTILATAMKVSKRIGKVPVVVGNCFGFVANRMLAYYLRESYLLLEEGATVGQIDRVLTDFGMPVGPFGMEDIAGIDVGARIRHHLAASGRTMAEGPQSTVPDRLFETGRYGQKTGAGWYKYDAGSRARVPDPLIDQLAAEAAATRGIARRAVPDAEILARTMTAVANEGARVLDGGFAARAGDVDIIYCYGFGFPRYRGGPLFYADTIGLPTLLARVKDYRDRCGDYWQPAPLLERLVAEGRGFYE